MGVQILVHTIYKYTYILVDGDGAPLWSHDQKNQQFQKIMTNNSFAHRAILDLFVGVHVVYGHSLAFKLCICIFSNLELVF